MDHAGHGHHHRHGHDDHPSTPADHDHHDEDGEDDGHHDGDFPHSHFISIDLQPITPPQSFPPLAVPIVAFANLTLLNLIVTDPPCYGILKPPQLAI